MNNYLNDDKFLNNMKTIYFIRHAQSTANANHIVQGVGLNVELSELGIKQATLLAKKVKMLTFDKLLSSPAKRALTTTQLAFPGRSFETSSELIEVSMGEWEGKPRSEVLPKDAAKFMKKDALYTLSKGESLTNAQERMVKYISSLESGTYVIVSHSMVIRLFLCSILGMPVMKAFSMEIPNTAIIKCYEKQWDGDVVWRVDIGTTLD